jgi:hypothetical protein
MEFGYQTDEDDQWHSLGQLKRLSTLFPNKDIKWRRIRFQVFGVSRGEVPVFLGFDVLRGINEGTINDTN